MKIGPRFKIAKRLGAPIFEKTQTRQFQLSQARAEKAASRKKTGKRGGSDFKRQLTEVQKVRFGYGITESQLSRYIKAATEKKGAMPAATLLASLESRLDNVIYRIGLVDTRRAARQMVSHGHITINGRRVTVPSLSVTPGMKIAVREGSKGSVLFQNLTERLAEKKTPAWISFDIGTLSGEMKTVPTTDSVDLIGDFGAVLEFYSR